MQLTSHTLLASSVLSLAAVASAADSSGPQEAVFFADWSNIGVYTVQLSSLGASKGETSYEVQCPKTSSCSLNLLPAPLTVTMGETTQIISLNQAGQTAIYWCSYSGTKTASCVVSANALGIKTKTTATFDEGEVPTFPVVFVGDAPEGAIIDAATTGGSADSSASIGSAQTAAAASSGDSAVPTSMVASASRSAAPSNTDSSSKETSGAHKFALTASGAFTLAMSALLFL